MTLDHDPTLLSTLEASSAELVSAYPPVWRDRNKKVVAALSCPLGAVHSGRIRVTRWRANGLPPRFGPHRCAIQARADVFGYEPADDGTTHWHLNFADARLFVAYGSGLLAQDELQVAEHPALGAVAEAMFELEGYEPLTCEAGEPTPVLVRGVERRCVIDTAPALAHGRVHGLYGNRFRAAEPEVVRSAVTVLEPPTVSNILAIEAPTGCRGAYTAEQVGFVLRTAHAGFVAARRESPDPITVHTGFWGCGAYGGNRELMALLQVLAAHLAGVERMVFHTFDDAGMERYQAAEAALGGLALGGLDQTIAAVVDRGYSWGVSDGN